MVQIVTDSMSDLTPYEAREIGVVLLPLTIRFGTEEYREGIDISREEFFQRLRQSDVLPKTSQIPPDGFYKAFTDILSQKDTEILYIAGSSRISGCYQSACIARDMLDTPERVEIVDSLIAISSQALLVRMAAQERSQYPTAAGLAEYVEGLRNHQRCFGMADDLKYLVMGGRLSPLVAKVGTALSIKPMLKFEGGEILQAGLVRGKHKANAWYVEKLKQYPPREDIPILIAGCDCPAEAEKLKEHIENQKMTLPPVSTMGVGAVIGTHVGPGLMSISWIERETASSGR
ncbi:MAG: DegV family protein [Clostridia bacterium]|nr:DegV family protein [Clostridia bacterium]